MRRFNWLLWGFFWSIAWLFALAPFVRGADDLTDAINVERARYGLYPLAHDGNDAAWSADNNAHQRQRGMGHYSMGGARRQNAGWNQRSVAEIVAAWMSSAGHRAAMLAIDVTHCGGAFDGQYWTCNFSYQPKTIESKPAAETSPSTAAGAVFPAAGVPRVCSTVQPCNSGRRGRPFAWLGRLCHPRFRCH